MTVGEETITGAVGYRRMRTGGFWLPMVALVLFAITPRAMACTVPVFRYALDNWHGTADKDKPIGDSPVLKEFAERILAGDSAVWIQVDSGNKESDDAMFERLKARLTFFESVAELPEIDPNDPSSRLGPGPELALKFSVLRVKRDDPIVAELAGAKADTLPGDEPWIAPVFGRGRVLGIWPANRMDEEGIDEACFYLTGACSCQVKVQNPGWDLIVNVNWDERLQAVGNLASSTENGESQATEKPAEPKTESEAEKLHIIPVTFPPAVEIKISPFIIAGVLLLVACILIFKKRSPKT